MSTDEELLKAYAEDRSETAFTEVVQRHVQRVYSVALRQVCGDHALAEDVAQKVFADLARKAAELSREPILGGWLYRATIFAAAKEVREVSRRRTREESWEMTRLAETQGQPEPLEEGERVVVDQLLAGMNDRDRNALWLRFLDQQSYAAVGEALGMSENAARMCVERSLEKLRSRLSGKGITSTSAALAGILANQPVISAPAGIAAHALAAAAGASSAPIAAGMIIMKVSNVAITAVLLVSAGTFVYYRNATQNVRAEIQSLRAARLEQAITDAANRRLAVVPPPAARPQPEPVSGISTATVTAAPSTQIVEGVLPKVVQQAAPEYPAQLLEQKLSGRVRLEYIIDRNGRVPSGWVARSTSKEFEKASVAAAMKWNFEPGTHNGTAVATHLLTTISFDAENASVKVGEPETLPPPSPEWF